MTWGIASFELYLKIGAFSGANNIETKNRTEILRCDRKSNDKWMKVTNTAVGGIFD